MILSLNAPFCPKPWIRAATFVRGQDVISDSCGPGTIALFLLTTSALADVAGVASVIDGDTIEVHGQRIRLHGIDVPESRQLCRLDGKPWQCGKDAANALADKIARRPVTCEDLGRDRCGGRHRLDRGTAAGGAFCRFRKHTPSV